jgi:hypothetical protein
MTTASPFALISDALRRRFKKIRLFIIDFEGSMAATEVVMHISFLQLLKDHGVPKKEYVDVYEVEKNALGKTVRNIVKEYKDNYGLKGKEEFIQKFKEKCRLEGKNEKDYDLDLEALLIERQHIYDNIIRKYKILLAHHAKPLIRLAKENGAIVIVLSNGTDGIIREVLEEDGLVIKGGKNDDGAVPVDIDAVCASNSPKRIALENKFVQKRQDKEIKSKHLDPSCEDCLEEIEAVKKEVCKQMEGKKDYFLARLSKKWNILPQEIMVMEDNANTLENMQAALETLWKGVFKKKASLIGKIGKIYVRHELNWQKDGPEDADAVFSCPAPEPLLKEYGIDKLPTKNAPCSSYRPIHGNTR